jgi:fibronectin-binding autotransporter adhesin
MATFTWYGGSGDLGDANNWSESPPVRDPVTGQIIPFVPGPDDQAEIDGSGTLTGSLEVAVATVAGNFTLDAVSITAVLDFEDEGAITFDSGTLNVFGNPLGNEDIGGDSTGSFTQNGGDNSIGSGLLLGFGSGNGTYVLNGGTLEANFEFVGGAGVGNFEQTGGTNTTGGNSSGLILGSQQGSFGNYQLENASALTANVETIGDQGTGTFTQSGTSTNTDSLGLTVGNAAQNPLAAGPSTYYLTGGKLAVSNGNEAIGGTGTGQFNQNDGTDNNVGGGLLLGFGTGNGGGISDGTYNQFGGTLEANFEFVGGAGVGNFNQTGGTNTTGGNSSGLTLGLQQGSFGTYQLENGSALTANVETIGDQGTGTFIQSGSSTNTDSLGLTVGNAAQNPLAAGPSTYYLTGGTLAVGDVNNIANETIGGTGTGQFNQNAGTDNEISGGLLLGYAAGGNGAFNQGGGKLAADYEDIGDAGTGSLSQTAGTNTTGFLVIGNNDGGNGTYTLGGSGGLTINTTALLNGGLTLGQSAGATGVFNFNTSAGDAATLQIGGPLSIGLNGTGTFNQGGGTLALTQALTVGEAGSGIVNNSGGAQTVTGNLTLGDQASSSGKYTLSGTGALTLVAATSGNRILSVGNYGNGTFVQEEGTVNVDDVFIAGQAGSTGQVMLSGAGTVLSAIDPTSGIADQIGFAGTGSLSVTDGAEFADGGALVLGFHSGAAGTLAVSQGGDVSVPELVIGGGSTVGGQGTVTASTGGVVTVTSVDPTNGFSVFMWPGATIDVTGGGAVDVGPTVTPVDGAVKIGRSGVLRGAGQILGNLIVNGDVAALGGTLSITGNTTVNVGNGGALFIRHGATLDLNGTASGRVTFGDDGAGDGIGTTLKLHPQSYSFSAAIRGLVLGDTIDLANTIVTSATVSSGTLTAVTDTGANLTYNVGNVGNDVFAVGSDGNGGTDLTLSTSQMSGRVVLTTATEQVPLQTGTVVATFTDTNLSSQASDYTASIDWGDGTTSPGTVAGANGTFTVLDDPHTYADEGNYLVAVAITHPADGQTINRPAPSPWAKTMCSTLPASELRAPR